MCESVCCPPPIRMRRAAPLARNPGGRTLPCFLGRNLWRILPDALSRRGSPFALCGGGGVCQVSQSTTRPSEGPCCSALGQGWQGLVVVGLRASSTLCLSGLLVLYYQCGICSVLLHACLYWEGWRSTTHHVGSSFHPGNDMERACTGSDQMFTVYSTRHDVFWVLRLTGPCTGQM